MPAIDVPAYRSAEIQLIAAAGMPLLGSLSAHQHSIGTPSD